MTLLATVFDLDDTLVDSAATWHEVVSAVAARRGGLVPDRSASECVDGMIDAIARGAFGLLPGAAELVALAAELGPVGLVSTSPRRYVRAVASASGLLRHVQVIVAGDDVLNGRPAPDPYLLAARRLNLEPAQCLAIDDSGAGIRSARAAGMTVLAADAKTAAKEICQLWVNVYALSR